MNATRKTGRSNNFGCRVFLPAPAYTGPASWNRFVEQGPSEKLAHDDLEPILLPDLAPRDLGEWGLTIEIVGLRMGGRDTEFFQRKTMLPVIATVEWGNGGIMHQATISAHGQAMAVPGQGVVVKAGWQRLHALVAAEWDAASVADKPRADLEGVYVQASIQRTMATRSARLSLMTMLGKAVVNQFNNTTVVPPFAESVRHYWSGLAAELPKVYGANALYFAGTSTARLDSVFGATEVQRLIGNAWRRPLPEAASRVLVDVDNPAQNVAGIAEYTLQI